jgi:hypothetical protein
VQQSAEPTGLRLLAIRAANVIGKPFGIAPFPRAFQPLGKAEGVAGMFDQIYHENMWGSGESRSGLGSEKSYAAEFVDRLSQCLREIDAHSLFDAPCGDLNWIEPILEPGLRYSGGDISAALINSLRPRHPGLDLRQFDICQDPFPQSDVWLCRDCLFHLPFAGIRQALANFSRSEIPWALITTHRGRLLRNLDVEAGGFRYLDLERAPINLPPPERYLKDYRVGRDFPRYVGLWRRETIKAAVDRWRD